MTGVEALDPVLYAKLAAGALLYALARQVVEVVRRRRRRAAADRAAKLRGLKPPPAWTGQVTDTGGPCGQVVRWYRHHLREAPAVTASADGVLIHTYLHEVPHPVLVSARVAHLALARGGDVSHLHDLPTLILDPEPPRRVP